MPNPAAPCAGHNGIAQLPTCMSQLTSLKVGHAAAAPVAARRRSLPSQRYRHAPRHRHHGRTVCAQTLSLAGNRLAELPRLPEALVRLDLSCNALTELSAEIMTALTALTELSLSGNPLTMAALQASGIIELPSLCHLALQSIAGISDAQLQFYSRARVLCNSTALSGAVSFAVSQTVGRRSRQEDSYVRRPPCGYAIAPCADRARRRATACALGAFRADCQRVARRQC